MRIAVVGHRTYFENHYPEGWQQDSAVLCLDVDEGDYGWLNIVHNFRPDLSLFYRPELYPERLISRIGGVRIAFLSEPVPRVVEGRLVETEETKLRTMLYGRMPWDRYHYRVYYDPSKADATQLLGYPIDEFRELPINTDWFHPTPKKKKLWDIVFVGKATPHRTATLDFLRTAPFKFLWVAHGASGRDLASIFSRAKIVLNVHADGQAAIEPRIYLAAACGARVLTEPLSSRPSLFHDRIIEISTLNTETLAPFVERYDAGFVDRNVLERLSVRTFLSECAKRFEVA